MTKCDVLYEIYETFIDFLLENGWKGEFHGWQETTRSEVTGESWSLFELDNGFRLGFKESAEENEEEHILQYWFEDNETPVKVESLEQLLELL